MKRLLLSILIGAAVAACSGDAETGATDDPASTSAEGTGEAGTDGVTDEGTADPGTADSGPEDPTPEFQPLANVYPSNPIDTPQTEEVELRHVSSEDHSLQGPFANVRNCLPDLENGKPAELNVGIPLQLTMCTPTHSALPGEDGTYRHITPPDDAGSNDDSMAEVMMYHHMQLIHDYYKDVHGLSDLDYPLDALVNIQAHLDAGVLCNEWNSIGNAAFMPAEAGGQFMPGVDFGLEGAAIVFGQTATKDFSYDADVIYHEYTHAMVGATRLNAVFPDSQGLNNLPGALNEAYADYFAGTLANESVVGNYALNDVEPMTVCGFPLGEGGFNMARDMSAERKCPDDLTAEVHADGEIFASALWAVREAIGAEKADSVILGALVGFTQTTDFDLAATATISRAKSDLDAQDAAAVEAVFEERGLIGCERVVYPGTVGARGIPLRFEGSDSFQLNPFGDFVPGYMQFRTDLPAGVTEIKVTVQTQGEANLEIAWKPGDKAIVYNAPFAAGHDAFVVRKFEPNGDAYTTRLAGNCLSEGPWVFSIHNKGGGTSVTAVATWARDEPVDDINFDAPCGD